MANRQKVEKLNTVSPHDLASGLAVNDVAPAALDQLVDDALAMQLISIRLPQRLIDDLKLIAKKESLGYQPLMRRVLVRFAGAELRAMARAELGETTQVAVAHHDDCEEAPRLAVGCR